MRVKATRRRDMLWDLRYLQLRLLAYGTETSTPLQARIYAIDALGLITKARLLHEELNRLQQREPTRKPHTKNKTPRLR